MSGPCEEEEVEAARVSCARGGGEIILFRDEAEERKAWEEAAEAQKALVTDAEERPEGETVAEPDAETSKPPSICKSHSAATKKSTNKI